MEHEDLKKQMLTELLEVYYNGSFSKWRATTSTPRG